MNIQHPHQHASQEARRIFLPDSASRTSATRNESATEQRSGAIAWLVMLIIAATGYAAGGFVGSAAFVAGTVAACLLANLLEDAKELARKEGAIK